MPQEGLEVTAELAAENLEEEVKWLVGAQVVGVVEYLEGLEIKIHQLAGVYQPTIHQSLMVRCWWVATIHWR